MSLKANIGDFTPNTFGNQIDWKQLREQNAIPFQFFMKISRVKEIETKSGDTAIIIEGDAELDETGLNTERLSEFERISGLKRDRPTLSTFFPIGTMFVNQMKDKFGEDWRELKEYPLCHIAYNGKLDNPKRKGTEFHQTFITLVPEVEQATLPEKK